MADVLQEIEKTEKVLQNVRIQLDNTTRENKNNFVMSLCAWIVEIGLVKHNIRVGFAKLGMLKCFSFFCLNPKLCYQEYKVHGSTPCIV